jgi:hypothetical protein
LVARELIWNPAWFNVVTGVEGVMCGVLLCALFAEILNEAHQKTVLSICPVKQKRIFSYFFSILV